MKKIFVSGNYLIIDNDRVGDGSIFEFPLTGTVYESTETGYVIRRGSKQFVIETDDIPNWYDETGTTPYNETTFVELLRTNTGI